MSNNQSPVTPAPVWSAPEVSPAPPAASMPAKLPKAPKKQDRATMALLLMAALIAVGGVGFALGHATASSTNTSTVNARPSGRFNPASLAPGQTFDPAQFGGGSRLGGAASLSGTVQAINGSTLILQEANGNTVTIDLTGTTTYHGETVANMSQIGVGNSVTIQLNTAALASGALPSARSSGITTLTAKDVLITTP